MDYYVYNDSLLIYLSKEGDEDAYKILIDKYSFLISKKIKDFNLVDEYDDIFQECLLVLAKSIDKFNDELGIRFYTFFLRNLENRLKTLYVRKSSKDIIYDSDNLLLFCDSIDIDKENELSDLFIGLTRLEKDLLTYRYIKNIDSKEVAAMFDLTLANYYFHLNKAKEKVRKNYEKIY